MNATQTTDARRLLILLLILAASPIDVLAQGTDPETAVAALKVGESVRLDVMRIGRMEGSFLSTSDRTFILTRNGEPAQVQVGDIERLWVRGRSTRRDALIGALVGCIFGIWLGTEFAGACDIDGEPCATPLGGAAAFGLLFGAGGLALGTGVGFAIPTWRLRFP